MEPEKEVRYSLSEKTINQVLGYLGTRPFTEVVALINAVNADAKPVVESEVKA